MAEIHESKTSGNLLEVKNNGVTAFSVDVAGDIAYSGTASYEDLEATGNADIAGNADVGGDLAVVGEVAGGTLAVSGAAATGALTVTGAASVSTTLQITGGAIKDTAGLSRIVFAPAKTIVDGAATALFRCPIAAGASIGGTINFHVFATDATDHQAISGIATFSSVNKAGTLTSTITYVTANEAKSVSSGTLTLAFTMAETVADHAYVLLQPTGSLTETAYTVTYNLSMQKGAAEIL